MPDQEAAVKKLTKELNTGTVSLLLLALLGRAGKPMYGYQIAKRLEAAAAGELPMKQGTLYPVLRSLEAAGWLTSEVEPSVSGPPRRYYSVTAAGLGLLEQWRAIWRHTRELVDRVVEGTDDSGGEEDV